MRLTLTPLLGALAIFLNPTSALNSTETHKEVARSPSATIGHNPLLPTFTPKYWEMFDKSKKIREVPEYGEASIKIPAPIGPVKWCRRTPFKDRTERLGSIVLTEVACYHLAHPCVQQSYEEWKGWQYYRKAWGVYQKEEEYFARDVDAICKHDPHAMTDHYITTQNSFHV